MRKERGRRNGALGGAWLLILGSCASALPASEPLVLDVWPGGAPGEVEGIGPETVLESKPDQKPVRRLTNVTRPTVTVLRPGRDKDTGASVLIAPGGGYNILAWDLEGEEVAAWLNSVGVTGIILKYRVPRRPGQAKDAPPLGPLQDAQRALRLVRSKAEEWGLDAKRLGMLGFSAGGHLTAATATGFDRQTYEPIDSIDKLSCRPDFAVLIYPAYLVNAAQDGLAADIRVSDQSPPMFLVHAGDDRISAENSLLVCLALRKARVPAEVHVYVSGGHGFGLRPTDQPCTTWPQQCAAWLARQGFLRR